MKPIILASAITLIGASFSPLLLAKDNPEVPALNISSGTSLDSTLRTDITTSSDDAAAEFQAEEDTLDSAPASNQHDSPAILSVLKVIGI